MAPPPPSSSRVLAILSSDYEPPVLRRAAQSLSELQTAFIQLSPTFFAALEGIAPKKRRGQVRYVIAAALLVVGGAIFADASTRSFVVERGHALLFKAPVATGAGNEPAAPDARDAPQLNAPPPVRPPAPAIGAAPAAALPAAAARAASIASPAVTSDAPAAPAAKPILPDAKPTKDARTPAAAPAKKNSRKSSTHAPRPASPQTARAPAVVVATRDTDGF